MNASEKAKSKVAVKIARLKEKISAKCGKVFSSPSNQKGSVTRSLVS